MNKKEYIKINKRLNYVPKYLERLDFELNSPKTKFLQSTMYSISSKNNKSLLLDSNFNKNEFLSNNKINELPSINKNKLATKFKNPLQINININEQNYCNVNKNKLNINHNYNIINNLMNNSSLNLKNNNFSNLNLINKDYNSSVYVPYYISDNIIYNNKKKINHIDKNKHINNYFYYKYKNKVQNNLNTYKTNYINKQIQKNNICNMLLKNKYNYNIKLNVINNNKEISSK